MTKQENGPHKDEPQKIHTVDSNILPTMPRPGTRRAAVLGELLAGQTLTQAQTLRRGWGWRLAADIFALREKGWQIVSEEIRQTAGNPIARYWLPAGKRGSK